MSNRLQRSGLRTFLDSFPFYFLALAVNLGDGVHWRSIRPLIHETLVWNLLNFYFVSELHSIIWVCLSILQMLLPTCSVA